MNNTTSSLPNAAAQALQALRDAGFDQAQVTASRTRLSEVNAAHNTASLLRSTDAFKLSLMGISAGRMASTELATLDADTVAAAARQLHTDAQAAPVDDAYAVSSGQTQSFERGPIEADVPMLADKLGELLDWRAAQTPKVIIEEAQVLHQHRSWHTVTTGGSALSGDVGEYGLGIMFTGKDGERSSSFNYTGGNAHDLNGPMATLFGVDRLLHEAERQIHTRAPSEVFGGNFMGDVLLTPAAVGDLMSWLLAQVSDSQLIAGTSLYRERVGQAIASPLLSLHSRFDAPGCAPQSGDAFVTPPVRLIDQGRLQTLTPSLYASRKLGLPHTPTASGWAVAAGSTPLAQITDGIDRGAVVGRLSMGQPAANGDFAGVIKNSFAVQGGDITHALSEAMISGNMADMLLHITAVSAQRIDTGAWCLPWLRISGLHFS